MHLPATVGGLPPPADSLAALKLYSSLGLRCFPATYLDKTPHPRVGRWGLIADSPPLAPPVWDRLTDGFGKFNVAIPCDEHLVVIDLDNLDFVAWFDAQGPERLGTWIVRTPSGGLHVYVRSDDAQRTTIIKAASGVKIGDVKARGGYVIAPPSVGSNGDYETEYGSPDAITRQANAITWFVPLVEAWERTQPVRLQPGMNDQPDYAKTDVHGAPPDARQEEMLAGLRGAWMNGTLNRKVYDTLKDGPDAADGYWKNADDRSDIDFGCVKELINLGWGFPEIEELWTFSPVGERYRDRSARAHGHGYMLRTFDNAKRKWDAEQVNLLTAVGPDWKLLDGVEGWWENQLRHFKFRLQNTTHPRHEVHEIEIDGRAFATPAEFRRAVYGRGLFFDLGNFSDQKGLRVLASAVYNLAVERPRPEMATREGHLRLRIRVMIESHVIPRTITPDEEMGDWMAWWDGTRVWVHAARLQFALQRSVTPPPKEDEVWRQVEQMGGQPENWKAQFCWRIPRSSLPGLQLF